jgi:hypothetical protein
MTDHLCFEYQMKNEKSNYLEGNVRTIGVNIKLPNKRDNFLNIILEPKNSDYKMTPLILFL